MEDFSFKFDLAMKVTVNSVSCFHPALFLPSGDASTQT